MLSNLRYFMSGSIFPFSTKIKQGLIPPSSLRHKALRELCKNLGTGSSYEEHRIYPAYCMWTGGCSSLDRSRQYAPNEVALLSSKVCCAGYGILNIYIREKSVLIVLFIYNPKTGHWEVAKKHHLIRGATTI